ncbi:SDR family NAD(P)-dependent oxidoreductase [Nocardia brasiliensis]|uniref:SDR family NAD(P)-dependent oxidoreductase n=1 Tax=Nocardia brasiliensis TaxID=37326 RepID=UPI0018935D07|nr:SDR family NAD(P)-dependent oxidoreductase [Nocardia brasiliensis]MBF6125828.1 SDR family oxidoreductase [Nocardia brasiliensis]MBF6543164.1 SDR family oxidoreductase [Nocardia brasiliensis]
MNRLDDSIALVTGAAGVFGTAIATRYAEEGATLVLTDVDATRLQATVKTVEAVAAAPVSAFVADLTEPAEVTRLFAHTDETWGRLDVLINNAGGALRSPLVFHNDADWRRMLRVNLDTVFYCSRQAVRRMLPRRSGRIINVASALGLTGGADEVAYATAKAAVIGFTRSVAQEVGRRGVCVNAICPTLADSGVSREYFGGFEVDIRAVAAYLARRAAMPRPIAPDDVADVAVFLGARESAYLNGQAILVGGVG